MKPVVITGHIFFVGLLMLAGCFADERVIFADTAYHLYELIKTREFQIQNLRFISVLSQAAVLLGIEKGLTLSALVKIYSLSFIGWHYLFFILLVHVLKDQAVAMAMLLVYALFVLHTFFWVQSEFAMGLMLLFVAYAILRKGGSWRILFVLLLIPVLFSHPMMMPVIVFLMGYELVSARTFRKFFHWAVIIVVVAFFFIKSHLPWTAYEANRISLQQLWHNLPLFFQGSASVLFLKWMVTDYVMLAIGLGWVLVHYHFRQERLKCILVAVFFTGYALLVTLAYPDMRQHLQFYFENLFLPLALFVAIPLALEVMPAYRPGLRTFILTGTCTIKIIMLIGGSKVYSERLQYIGSMISQASAFRESKFLVDRDDLDIDVLGLEWALPCETLLYSSLRDSRGSITIKAESDPEAWLGVGENLILEPFGSYPQERLDSCYFHVEGAEYGLLQLNSSAFRQSPER
ncbi:MAG: hypothetical protein KatS3mg031_2054 [Chitinophagales bacterium]|nr:MAG: hypothetical protein KatS3mg031_2054 [Chitinophagales bacterium]